MRLPIAVLFVALWLPGIARGQAAHRAPVTAPLANEPLANAHVLMVARSQAATAREARLADVEIWAEGSRLRARVRGGAGELWRDGLGATPLRIVAGEVAAPAKGTLEAGLALGLRPSPSLANANTDRVAGHPCKLVTEHVAGATLTRCLWRGLPLSVELKARGFSFNAAATLVEEGAVTVADLQPPPGAPAAPASLRAGN